MVFGGDGIVSAGEKAGDTEFYCVQRAMAKICIYNGERRVADMED